MKIRMKDIAEAVAALAPFDANSARGRRVGGLYLVYSYDTLVLLVDARTHEVRFFDYDYRSATTRRVQNQIRAALGLAAASIDKRGVA